MGRSRLLEPSPIGLIGGVLAIISCFLAWGEYSDTFDVPLKFLWDEDATGGVELGIPLVSVAGVVTLLYLDLRVRTEGLDIELAARRAFGTRAA